MAPTQLRELPSTGCGHAKLCHTVVVGVSRPSDQTGVRRAVDKPKRTVVAEEAQSPQ
jgi:hypothetical protein